MLILLWNIIKWNNCFSSFFLVVCSSAGKRTFLFSSNTNGTRLKASFISFNYSVINLLCIAQFWQQTFAWHLYNVFLKLIGSLNRGTECRLVSNPLKQVYAGRGCTELWRNDACPVSWSSIDVRARGVRLFVTVLSGIDTSTLVSLPAPARHLTCSVAIVIWNSQPGLFCFYVRASRFVVGVIPGKNIT